MARKTWTRTTKDLYSLVRLAWDQASLLTKPDTSERMEARQASYKPGCSREASQCCTQRHSQSPELHNDSTHPLEAPTTRADWTR
jgi:hypothetical protein